MRKKCYDIASLEKCRLAAKDIRIQIHCREDHVAVLEAVHKAFELLHETTGSAIFSFESSIGMEYQEALESGVKRTELDSIARDCKNFLLWEIDRLYESLDEVE